MLKPNALILILILSLSSPLLAAVKGSKGMDVKTETKTEVKGKRTIMTRIVRFTVGGNKAILKDFNVNDYKKALLSDKLIVLLFGEKEYKNMKEAFKDLKDNKVIGFKVDYKDKNSDRAEKKLAKAFKVEKAGTKILIKNGAKLKQTAKYWGPKDYTKIITAAQKK